MPTGGARYVEDIADGIEDPALPSTTDARYANDMANATSGPSFTRREWMRVSAIVGAAVGVGGCASGPEVTTEGPPPSPRRHMLYDVIIMGGGPAGLSAALTLGRARKRTLLCDAGPRRNAAAQHLHNFVTRDGTTPETFRETGRKQLEAYPNVQVSDAVVESISGSRGAFRAMTSGGAFEARRLLLSVGMRDEVMPIEGFAELWGHSIFQCPYCHGWEQRDRRFAFLARSAEMLHFAPLLRGWTRDVVVFTDAAFDVPGEVAEQLRTSGVLLEKRPIARLRASGSSLEAVELADGAVVPCDVLFVNPPQRQVEIVKQLGVSLDADGFVKVDPMTRETSTRGIYAAGDLTTRMQAAIAASAMGMHAAASLNHELTLELATSGQL